MADKITKTEDVADKFFDGRGKIGSYAENTGGGHPFSKGNSNTRTTGANGKIRQVENEDTDQARTSDGKFTYKSANGETAKYPGRGKTVPPQLTGGKNGVYINEEDAQEKGGISAKEFYESEDANGFTPFQKGDKVAFKGKVRTLTVDQFTIAQGYLEDLKAETEEVDKEKATRVLFGEKIDTEPLKEKINELRNKGELTPEEDKTLKTSEGLLKDAEYFNENYADRGFVLEKNKTTSFRKLADNVMSKFIEKYSEVKKGRRSKQEKEAVRESKKHKGAAYGVTAKPGEEDEGEAYKSPYAKDTKYLEGEKAKKETAEKEKAEKKEAREEEKTAQEKKKSERTELETQRKEAEAQRKKYSDITQEDRDEYLDDIESQLKEAGWSQREINEELSSMSEDEINEEIYQYRQKQKQTDSDKQFVSDLMGSGKGLRD